MWQKAVPDLRTQLDSVRLAAECGAVTCPSVPRAERTPPLAADPLALPLSMAVCADAAAAHTPWGDLRGWVSITGRALDVRRHSWRTGTSSKRCTTCSGCTQSSRCGGNGTALRRPNAQPRTLRTGNTGAGGAASGHMGTERVGREVHQLLRRVLDIQVEESLPLVWSEWRLIGSISGSEPVTAVPADPQHCPLAATRALQHHGRLTAIPLADSLPWRRHWHSACERVPHSP